MSQIINFLSSDFTYSRPTFIDDYAINSNLKFANTGFTFNLDFDGLVNTEYGYVIFTVTYSGALDYVYLTFYQKGGPGVSVSTALNEIFLPSSDSVQAVSVVKDDVITGNTQTFYVVVNALDDIKSSYLFVDIAVGSIGAPPANSSVTLNFTCPNPIYQYETGVHVYSPYDAISSISKLTTKLYSFTEINYWTINTVVYSNSLLSNPALPWYYGYGDYVYKVGAPFDRRYGFTREYEIRKKLIGKARLTEITKGPEFYYDSVNETSYACVEPLMGDVGLIKKIIPTGSTVQPLQYRYYMGYDYTNIYNSNDSIFTVYSFKLKNFFPITGSQHALTKYKTGWLIGTRKNFQFNEVALERFLLEVGSTAIYIISKKLFLKYVGGITAENISTILTNIAKFVVEDIGKGVLKAVTKQAINTFARQFVTFTTTGAFPTIMTILAVAYLLYNLFKTTKIHISEACRSFLHHFTNTPYIEISSELYRKSDLSERNTGYYSDGIYFYRQQPSGSSVNTITRKFPSYTNAFITDDPLTTEFQYSLIPDNPTFINDYQKLVVLSYTSGQPMPYCGGNTIYYSTKRYYSFTPTGCCDFEICKTVEFTLPDGITFSCVSQEDADNQAEQLYENLVFFTENRGNYIETRPDGEILSLITSFTHELKIENNPTQVEIYYDSKQYPSVVIGTTLYFDYCGCHKVLNGYYAVSGESVYRTFYHTTNGVIDGIYEMLTSSSTTTVTSEPILTTNLDYSSNWYLYSRDNASLFLYSMDIETKPRNFDPNSLYSNPVFIMKKGFIKTPTTLNDFQVYDNFNTTTHSEADEGFYIKLIDFITPPIFYYGKSRTIYLHVEEDCDFKTNPSITTRGIYIIGKDYSNQLQPTINPVNLTIQVFTNNSVLLDTYTVTTKTYYAKTFVKFDSNKIGLTTNVTNIEIKINSQNPWDKITYRVGTISLCLAACNLTLTSSNITNTSATVTVAGGTPNYTYVWYDVNNNNTQIKSINNTPSTTDTNTNLQMDGAYKVSVEDSLGCTKSINIYTKINEPTQQTKYILINYIWDDTNFDFLEATRIVDPYVGMTMRQDQPISTLKEKESYTLINSNIDVKSTDTIFAYVAGGDDSLDDRSYVFLNRYYPYPRYKKVVGSFDARDEIIYGPDNIETFASLGDYILRAGGYSKPRQFNSVLIHLDSIFYDYPGATGLTIDLRGRWHGAYNSTPQVKIEAKFFNSDNLNVTETVTSPRIGTTWVINNPTDMKTYNSFPVTVNTNMFVRRTFGGIRRSESSFWTSGDRVAVLKYDRVTNQITLDSNDTTTETI